jgi:hypothetical protein
VFRSRKGRGPLDESAVHRVVKAAAERAGLSAEVSAHWLRHAHASHSLDRSAPIHLMRQTLGARLGGHHGALSARPPLRTARRGISGSELAGAAPRLTDRPHSPRPSEQGKNRGNRHGVMTIAAGRDVELTRIMGVTHRKDVRTVTGSVRRANLFKGHTGASFL